MYFVENFIYFSTLTSCLHYYTNYYYYYFYFFNNMNFNFRFLLKTLTKKNESSCVVPSQICPYLRYFRKRKFIIKAF